MPVFKEISSGFLNASCTCGGLHVSEGRTVEEVAHDAIHHEIMHREIHGTGEEKMSPHDVTVQVPDDRAWRALGEISVLVKHFDDGGQTENIQGTALACIPKDHIPVGIPLFFITPVLNKR